MTLTSSLVRLIRDKPADRTDLEAAALFVLDTLGCAVGGTATAQARMLGAVSSPEADDVARRAFHLGGLAHILEMDDLHRDSVTHPGCVVVPAAFVLAEALDLRGGEFLKAVLAGYEACCRVGMSVGKAHYRVWHNTSTCGPFGSAMAAAELLALTDEQAVWALGNAGTQACGLWQFLESGAMSKHLHTARAAEAGVLAARLAQAGFTGAADILEGSKGFYAGLCKDPAPEAIAAEPARPWELANTSIKPWPCCRHTHPLIDAAIEINGRLAGAPVARATVRTYRAALDVCDRPQPEDPYSARFSLQHCAAVALLDGQVDRQSFEVDARTRVAALRDRVQVDAGAAEEARYPASWGAHLVVETKDGTLLEASRQDAPGDPENPVGAGEIAAKARMLMADAGVAPRDADRLVAAILDLPDDRPLRDAGLPRLLSALATAQARRLTA